jgi:hypothetical protein
MTAVTFDTLEAVKRLRDAGYDEKQAEAIVRVIGDAQERLVTKEHFDGRFNLLQWMVGFNLALTLAVLWKVVSG